MTCALVDGVSPWTIVLMFRDATGWHASVHGAHDVMVHSRGRRGVGACSVKTCVTC